MHLFRPPSPSLGFAALHSKELRGPENYVKSINDWRRGRRYGSSIQDCPEC